MPAWIALLRAVNVGGTGKLAMSDLKAMCDELGFASTKTYIASGNVVFKSGQPEAAIKAALEKRLETYAGKPVGVLDRAPPADALEGVRGQKNEKICLGRRVIYVHYGDGMGSSKLVIPAAKAGTARNMNTIATLAKMAAEL